MFWIWKNYRATEPFPGIGFQTTNEQRSPDNLPRSEVKQRNPIGMDYRADRAKHKFPGARSAGFDCLQAPLLSALLIVYPSLLRSVRARWKQAFGTV